MHFGSGNRGSSYGSGTGRLVAVLPGRPGTTCHGPKSPECFARIAVRTFARSSSICFHSFARASASSRMSRCFFIMISG